MCEANKRIFILKEPPSDYNCQIMKSHEKKQRQSRSSSSDIPQLRAQRNQTIEPLIVEQTTKQQHLITFLKETNLTSAQVAGGEDIPKAQVIARWQFQLGTSLVPPEVVSLMPTKMRWLNNRYILLMSQCVFMSGAKIKDDDFFRGEAIIWINWEEVYQLYHQDALDVSMVGLWVL